MNNIVGMCFDVQFDRPIIADKHYISPGGYAIKKNGKIINFDFTEYAGNISTKDPTILHCEVNDLDKESFPEAEKLTVKDFLLNPWNEFFIYTGEDEEPEINPVKIKGLTLIFSDGYLFSINPERVNKILSN